MNKNLIPSQLKRQQNIKYKFSKLYRLQSFALILHYNPPFTIPASLRRHAIAHLRHRFPWEHLDLLTEQFAQLRGDDLVLVQLLSLVRGLSGIILCS